MIFANVQPMHIPDGFMSVAVSVALWLLSIVAIAVALRRVNRDLDERKIPLMGVLAATLFAGQMLNFAVTGGTSGHLMGAALATILLGPWAAILVMTAVVGIQALIFQDGGMLALGANLFNMGVVGVAVSFFAYRTVMRLARGQKWGIFAGGFAAGWLSIFIAALAVALELALSGTSPANLAVPAMGGDPRADRHRRRVDHGGRAGVPVCRATRPGHRRLARAWAAGKAVWVGGLIIAVASGRAGAAWPRPTPTGWSGSPSSGASWTRRRDRLTTSSPTTCSPACQTRRSRRSSRAPSGCCLCSAWSRPSLTRGVMRRGDSRSRSRRRAAPGRRVPGEYARSLSRSLPRRRIAASTGSIRASSWCWRVGVHPDGRAGAARRVAGLRAALGGRLLGHPRCRTSAWATC